MDIAFGILISFLALIYSIYKQIFIGVPLMICFFVFVILAIKRGYHLREILQMAYKGGKDSFVIVKIFILIGGITASWMASGTVPGIVHYGIKFMDPNLFIFCTFLISTVVSFMLGTSFGTVSTVGVALMVIAKGGSVNTNIAAGAIIAGAYFGDRCSPMSSSANLVANLTETKIYTNIRNMFKTAMIPFIVSSLIYLVVSFKCPLSFSDNSIDIELLKIFNINFIVLLPALLILVLSIFRVDVNLSMFLSISTACAIALIFQDITFKKLVKDLIVGFNLNMDTPLKSIISGGGIISMLKAAFIIFVSCCLAGVIDGTEMLKNIYTLFKNIDSRHRLFLSTAVVSMIAAGFGGNQSIAIVLTNQIMKKIYHKKNIDKYELAIDIENTAVVLSPFIPWNISSLIPTTAMKVSPIGFMPYAFYLYLLPLSNIIIFKMLNKHSKKYVLFRKI